MKLTLDAKLARKGFSLELNEALDGKVFGVFGPSGSGKTTFLHIIAGLAKPDSGRLTLDEDTLLDTESGICVPAHRRRIGLVFQEGRLFPHLSVRKNLEYGTPAIRAAGGITLESIAELFQISRLLDKRPVELSGGERQRVALGRAILMEPRVLLLDEPLASLDGGIKSQIIPFLRKVKDETGIPMIYVSHDLTEVLDLTTSLLVMDGGRVLTRGSLYDVLKHRRAAELLRHSGLVNILKLRFVKAVPDDHLAEYVLEGAAGDSGACRICGPQINNGGGRVIHAVLNASDVILATGPHDGLSTRSCIRGCISEISQDGDRALCVVEGAARLMVEVTPMAVREMKLAPGVEVHCLFKAHAMKFLE